MPTIFFGRWVRPFRILHDIVKENYASFSKYKVHQCKLYNTSCDNNRGSITIARLMGPDDANINGNVHGGVILRLLEEAGAIAATRFCNNTSVFRENGGKPVYAVPTLARIEKMDFNTPMFIGEIAEFYSEVTFTSPHSLQVNVKVYAENPFKGEKRLTNAAHVWYVPVDTHNVDRVLPVAPLAMSPEQSEKGQMVYNSLRKQRLCTVLHLANSKIGDPTLHSVGHSSSILSKLVNPSDIAHHGYCRGGVIMKMMDECGAITAAKHCSTAVVTASLDATNFLQKVKLGALLTIHGVVTFTSKKSLEIQVLVDAEHPFQQDGSRHRAVEAFFTFVSLDSSHKVVPVPQLKIKSSQELSRFEAGKERYLTRRNMRKR